jgi:glycosyltransferase involved in cell wall biosynthesis
MEQPQSPLISCLCVTHGKPKMLERAIACFNYQSYTSKQLVIVYEETDSSTRTYIESQIFTPDIKIVAIPDSQSKPTLGELRNRSIRESDGDYVCQWDDDDWYSPDRLEIQMKYLRDAGKQASVLLRWIVYDAIAQKSYLSFTRPWEGSLLCKKTLLGAHPYPSLTKGEDSHVVGALIAGGYVAMIKDEPEIYVYNFHGANTWDELHFRALIYSSIGLPDDTNREVIECMAL